MWEQRWHPLREEWVIVAAHRQFRPWSSVEVAVQTPRPPAFDPTCYLWDTIGAQQDDERRDPATVLRDVAIRFDNLWQMPFLM